MYTNNLSLFLVVLTIASIVNASFLIETDKDGNTIISPQALSSIYLLPDLVLRYPPHTETPRHLALIPVRCPKGEYGDGSCRWECEFGENIWGGCLTRQQYCEALCEKMKASNRQLEWLRHTIPPLKDFPSVYPYEMNPIRTVDPDLLDKWLRLFPFSFDESSSHNWRWIGYVTNPDEW